jgi:hypothetical protein
VATRADIEINVKGLKKVQELSKQLDKVSGKVNQLNKGGGAASATKNNKLERESASLQEKKRASMIRVRSIGDQIQRAKEAGLKTDKATRALNRAALANSQGKFKVAKASTNAALLELKTLKAQTKELTQQKILRAARGGGFGGGRGGAGRGGGGDGALQSALVSGAFPLLFGQGPLGAATGFAGGFIGTKMGGQMGGFAGGLVATAALQQITTALAAITELGQALGPFIQNTQAVTTALGLQGTAEGERIRLIEETEGKTAAFNAAMQVMSGQIGNKGVTALEKFGESTKLLNTQFTLALTKIQAFAAGIANFVIKITGLQDKLEAGAAQDTVAAAAGGGDEQAQALVDRRNAAESMKSRGGEGRRKKELLEQISLEEKIFALRRNTKIEADTLIQTFDSLVKSITDEADETNRIIELRKQGLNPAVAKTIAGLEKEAKTNKENLQFEIDKLLEKQKQVGILGEADQTRLTLLEAQRNAIDGTVESTSNAVKEQDKLTRAATETLDKFKQIETAILGDIKNGIAGLIKGTSTLSDLLNNVADKFLDVALNQALFGNAGGSTVTGGLFSLFGFANGGRPPVGKPSIVGEKGPELFVPRSSGTIVPNNKLGGGGSTSVVVNVDASGTDVQGDDSQAKELGTLISVAVQGELIKQQRPGGLLASTR